MKNLSRHLLDSLVLLAMPFLSAAEKPAALTLFHSDFETGPAELASHWTLLSGPEENAQVTPEAALDTGHAGLELHSGALLAALPPAKILKLLNKAKKLSTATDAGKNTLPSLHKGVSAAHADKFLTITSRISDHPVLVKAAQKAGKSHQRSIDALTSQLSQGNFNPGIGSKHLFGNVYEARARDGARVYFRKMIGEVHVLGKSTKYNQTQVISILKELYE